MAGTYKTSPKPKRSHSSGHGKLKARATRALANHARRMAKEKKND